MKISGICMTALALLATSPIAQAAENTQRLCTDADLRGVFNMVDFKETPPGDETAWVTEYPTHYLVFNPSHMYGFVALRHKVTKPEDLEKDVALSGAEGLHTIERKYTLDAEGVLNLYIDDRLDYSYRCMIVLTPARGVQAGDLLLAGYSKKRSELYKVFRHWK